MSTALMISSSTKLLPILMVIWQYDVPAAARAVGWAVVINNIEALKVLLECSLMVATNLAFAGAFVRAFTGYILLHLIGWALGINLAAMVDCTPGSFSRYWVLDILGRSIWSLALTTEVLGVS